MKSGAPLLEGPFCFLRHGETEANRLAVTAGATDVALNETGLAQARAAARALAGAGIDAIYSSPLQRARTTAECVSATLAVPVVIIAELAERNWGELEGKPRSLRVRHAKPPGGEGPEEFAHRTQMGLARIARSRLPLIVAHSGTFRVLCRMLGVPEAEAPVENARPVRFDPPSAVGRPWRCTPLGPATEDASDIIG